MGYNNDLTFFTNEENNTLLDRFETVLKKVILVTARPLNNLPIDILVQIKLFQEAKNSTINSPKEIVLSKYLLK